MTREERVEHEALHSTNLLGRPEVGISVFDSAQPAGTGDRLQFAAPASRYHYER